MLIYLPPSRSLPWPDTTCYMQNFDICHNILFLFKFILEGKCVWLLFFFLFNIYLLGSTGS